MSISARTRREAILLLDVAASTPSLALSEVAFHLGLSSAHWKLAHEAAYAAFLEGPGQMTSVAGVWFSNGAGLLRDGWSPGDPVVRL